MSHGTERRRSPRRPILDSFSMFVSVDKKGDLKLKVHDVSDQGIGFDIDVDGEEYESFSPKLGDVFSVKLYLNQTLYIPLKIKVMRADKKGQNRIVGVEVLDVASKSYQAFLAFIKVIDLLVEAGKLTELHP